MKYNLALLGMNIQHSRSPRWHNQWLKEAGIDGSYILWPCTTPPTRDELLKSDFYGLNVTMPFKRDLAMHCDHLSPEAQATGAINTLRLKDGRIDGCNTDSLALLDFLKGYTFIDAVIIGKGATAHSSRWVLEQIGCQCIHMLGRDENIPKADIIINATPLGSSGYPDLEISKTFRGTVVDWAYLPNSDTKLVSLSRDQGCSVIAGPQLLEKQARLSFSLWFDALP